MLDLPFVRKSTIQWLSSPSANMSQDAETFVKDDRSGARGLRSLAFHRAMKSRLALARCERDIFGRERITSLALPLVYDRVFAEGPFPTPKPTELFWKVVPENDSQEWLRAVLLPRFAVMIEDQMQVRPFLVCPNLPECHACILAHGWRTGEPSLELVQAREDVGLVFDKSETYFFKS